MERIKDNGTQSIKQIYNILVTQLQPPSPPPHPKNYICITMLKKVQFKILKIAHHMITKTLYPIAFQSPITDVTQLTLQHPSTVLHKVLLYKQKRRISPQMYYKRQKKREKKKRLLDNQN